jgi:hypothetical protein
MPLGAKYKEEYCLALQQSGQVPGQTRKQCRNRFKMAG